MCSPYKCNPEKYTLAATLLRERKRKFRKYFLSIESCSQDTHLRSKPKDHLSICLGTTSTITGLQLHAPIKLLEWGKLAYLHIEPL